MIVYRIIKILPETFKQWQKDKVSLLAAALAYYTVFSVAPLLVIAVAIAGAVFGQDAAKTEIINQLKNLVGTEGTSAIVVALNNANQPEVGNIASLISVGVLLVGASGVFAQLQDALNTVWNVQPKPGKGIWGVIAKRLFSFLMVLAIGFLLLASLIISAVLSALKKFNLDFLPGSEFLWSNVDFVVSFCLITFMFALMFKYVPDVKITWKDVWIGAIITSLLFIFGKFLLGWYFQQGSLGSTYGAASSLIIFLAWVYYSAQIILFGAEFTQVYAHKYGSKIIPSRRSQRLELNN